MKTSSRLLLLASLLLPGGALLSQERAGHPDPGLKPPQAAAHLFDRLAFGARPGDVEKIEGGRMPAIRRWIETQLYPEKIQDQSLEKKLAKLKSLSMSPRELLAYYQRPEELAMKMGIKKEDFQKSEDLRKDIRQKIGEDKLPEEIAREMIAQRMIRAVESRRQLQEVLMDFWLNHFNIDITKGEERWLLPEFEKSVLKPRIFGKFRDLLGATAHSPAMLFYLDNQASQSPLDYRDPRHPSPRHGGGLNENYAREILELHTLGVDGGYTQSDVSELARILTGWSIDALKEDPVFKFREHAHDRGEKTFLGQRFPAERGIDEGERALDLIASHPATARFLSFKLARYFMADQPPKKLVDRMASVFLRTQGDLRQVYRTLFESAEFWSKAAYRAKVKKPTQFVFSSIRALGGEVDLKSDIPKALAAMGEEPYHCQPPTGYKDEANAWVNPGAMVNRLNFALKLASNRVEGAYVQLPRLDRVPDDSEKLVRQVEGRLLHEKLSPGSERVVLKEFDDEPRTMADGEVRPLSLSKSVGLILGSPEFQRR